MTVPSFADIGKNAWDILKTGYNYGYGIFNVSLTKKSDNDLQLNSNYSLNCDSSKADGNAETGLKFEKFGNLKQKWSSDGTITLEYGADGKPLDGLSLTTSLSHNPTTSISGLKLAAKFINEIVNIGCSVSNGLDTNFRINGAAVFGIRDFYLGYQAGYDTVMNTMTMNDFGLSYSYENIGFHVRATSLPYEGGASVFYKVNENWDTAINGILASNDNGQDWTLGVGTRFRIDEKTTIRMKLNKDRQMGASIKQNLYDFVYLTLSLNIDLNNFSRGDHKVGFAVDIDDS